jgi:hypothetical protein
MAESGKKGRYTVNVIEREVKGKAIGRRDRKEVKGSGSQDRIYIFFQKWIVPGLYKNLYSYFDF